MTHRERTMALLQYQPYDRLPIVHFGYWKETLERWQAEGHVSEEEARGWGDNNEYDRAVSSRLGFDYGWGSAFGGHTSLFPGFAHKVVRELGDGRRHVQNGDGVIVLERDDAVSIPMEVAHLLHDRASWEEQFLPRLAYTKQRIDWRGLEKYIEKSKTADVPQGLHIGSLYGTVRNWLGVQGISFLQYDDPGLYTEILDTMGALCLRVTQEILAAGARFDFAHFWEDICFNNGPLVSPATFREKVGPWYQKITDLLQRHGTEIVSLDCDGCIDALVPIWLENGVNTMFPIEVGTWGASIAPWRAQYGKKLRGIGGMNKTVFAQDYAAIDKEIARLEPLVALGGFIPCPDHRIAPDAKWENVQYYTAQMRKIFG